MQCHWMHYMCIQTLVELRHLITRFKQVVCKQVLGRYFKNILHLSSDVSLLNLNSNNKMSYNNRRHDSQYNDRQPNGLIFDPQHNWHRIIALYHFDNCVKFIVMWMSLCWMLLGLMSWCPTKEWSYYASKMFYSYIDCA